MSEMLIFLIKVSNHFSVAVRECVQRLDSAVTYSLIECIEFYIFESLIIFGSCHPFLCSKHRGGFVLFVIILPPIPTSFIHQLCITINRERNTWEVIHPINWSLVNKTT